MVDLSNKALALLLVVAIVVSLSGTLVSLSRMQEMGLLTGRATSNQLGYTNFTISSNFSITFINNLIPFGSGAMQGGACDMGSNNSPPTNDANCQGFNATVDTQNLTISNNGNVRANVSLNFTENATGFINGTNPAFRYNVYQYEVGSCATLANGTWPPGADALNNSRYLICKNLNYTDASDTLGVSIWVSLPVDAPIRANQVVITALGCDDTSCY